MVSELLGVFPYMQLVSHRPHTVAAPESRPSAEAIPDGRVLIVDDDPMFRGIMVKLFEEQGIRTVDVASSADACRALGENSFSLLLLDWDLSKSAEFEGGDRTGMCVLLKVRAQYPEMPVIVISGYAGTDVRTDAALHGATTYIEKPFSVDAILQNALTLMRQCENRRRICPRTPDQIVPLSEVNRRYVVEAVRLCDGNQTEAAKRCGISRNTLAAIFKAVSHHEVATA